MALDYCDVVDGFTVDVCVHRNGGNVVASNSALDVSKAVEVEAEIDRHGEIDFTVDVHRIDLEASLDLVHLLGVVQQLALEIRNARIELSLDGGLTLVGYPLRGHDYEALSRGEDFLGEKIDNHVYCYDKQDAERVYGILLA